MGLPPKMLAVAAIAPIAGVWKAIPLADASACDARRFEEGPTKYDAC